MKQLIGCMIFTAGLLSSLAADAGWFSSCDGASKEDKPEWVSKLDYSLPGHYVGVGAAEKYDGIRHRLSKEEQIKISENHAKALLVQEIEVKISTESNQNTQISKQGLTQDEQSKIRVSADEVLRGLKIKGRWVDPDTCTQYTLMVVNKDSVKLVKREKLMQNRFETFKLMLAEGENSDKNRDIHVRRKYLEEAKALLAAVDFKLLQEAEQGSSYAARMSDALARLEKESAQVKGRMAVVAFNEDGTLQANVMGKILDQIRTTDNTADRLVGECSTDDECRNLASGLGFSKLALLRASSQILMGQMGALKGTLTITKTVYDIERQRKQSQQTASAKVIGWSNDELDWLAAVHKAMKSLY